MSELSKETIAIVNATYEDVSSRDVEITLGMWHYLSANSDRDILLTGFEGEHGTSSTLLQALLDSIRKRSRGAWPRLRTPAGFGDASIPSLENALRRSLQRVLGDMAAPMVVNAWGEMFRDFMRALQDGAP